MIAYRSKVYIIVLLAVLLFGLNTKNVFAQTTSSTLYVPLIGITSVPTPLSLPKGPGNVTYNYAVKNFIQEYSLSNIKVVDDSCSPVIFANGDDNGNGELDYNETWRYTCTTKLSVTTQSTATVSGTVNDLTATHNAYATVVVGSNVIPPLVSIVNITKVAYPLSLPSGGGSITFTYRVNNPGNVPLSSVSVSDDKCNNISSRLGDTNNNNLLDLNEVWVYTCTTHLIQTTTNTAHVIAYANGLKATDDVTITVKVATPNLPETGTNPNMPVLTWEILAGVLVALIIFFFLIKRKKQIGARK